MKTEQNSRGIRRADNGLSLPNDRSMITVNIASVIVDRLRGASITHRVWEDTSNIGYIAERLKIEDDRETCAKFLIARGFSQVFEDIVATPTFRSGGLQASKSEVYYAIMRRVEVAAVADALTEMLIPILLENGMVAKQSHFTTRQSFPHAEVHMEQLRIDMLEQELRRALTEAKARFVLASGTHSTKAVGEMLGEAFSSVGIAIANIADYTAVLDDIVLGVYANIVPDPEAIGSVPTDIQRNTVVQQLVTNLTFIRAAVALRARASGAAGPHTADLKPATEGWRFDKYAPAVYTMLRSSERYQIVGRQEFAATVGTIRVRDLEGRPACVIVYDNAKMEAAAMSVLAQPDQAAPQFYCIEASRENIASHIKAAYGSIVETMSLKSAAVVLADVLSTQIESGTELSEQCYNLRLAGEQVVLSLQTVACMLAERVSIETTDSGEQLYIYRAPTAERTLRLTSGSIQAGICHTSDPVELLLALEDRDSTHTVAIPPQFLPTYALHTRMIGMSEDDFVSLSKRKSFDMEVFGTKLRGSLRLRELASMRAGSMNALVLPTFNKIVVDTVSAGLETAIDQARRIENTVARRRALRNVAAYVLSTAQSLAAGFRQEIHNSIIERVVSKLPYEESVAMRARLRQLALGAFVDVFAAEMFLHVQGLGEQVEREAEGETAVRETRTMFTAYLLDDEVKQFWAEIGSDRTL